MEVIPLRDAPGHVSGVLFRGATLEKLGVDFLRLFPTPGCTVRDPGLIIRKELLESKPDPNRTIILCHHCLDEYFMLQTRYFRENRRFPDVAFWFTDWQGDEETHTANWSWLKGNRLIFWMPTWDVRVFRQAAIVDAEIAMIHPERDIVKPFRDSLICDYRYRADSTLRAIESFGDDWGDFLSRAANIGGINQELNLPLEVYRRWQQEYSENRFTGRSLHENSFTETGR